MRRSIFCAAVLGLALLGAPSLTRAEGGLAEGQAPAEAPSVTKGVARASTLDLSGERDPAVRADLQAMGATDGASEFPWEMKLARAASKRRPALYDVTFPSPRPSGHAENDVVHCRFHAPEGVKPGERVPAVVVLHHLAGASQIEAAVAEYLARAGVAALEVEFPFYGPRRPQGGEGRERVEKGLLRADFAEGVAATRQSVADVRRAADWLLARGDVDARRLGMVGVSLGAIQGALTAGVDPRFRRNVWAIGGGDVPSILMNDSRETRRVREALQQRGTTRAELEALVSPIEPLRFAHRLDRSTILMLNAERDEVIPRVSTDKLWKAAGEPEIRWYPTGHATIAAFLLDVFAKTRAHIAKPADEAESPTAAPTPPAERGREF